MQTITILGGFHTLMFWPDLIPTSFQEADQDPIKTLGSGSATLVIMARGKKLPKVLTDKKARKFPQKSC